MLKGLGDMAQILKIQKEFKNVQKAIQKSEHKASSAGQEVSVTVNGDYQVTAVTISEDFIRTAKVGDVEKKVKETVNGAVHMVKDYSNAEIKKLTGGLDIPGLSGMFK